MDAGQPDTCMKPAWESIHPLPYRPGGSWLGRVSRSNVFAWAVSVGLHAGVFGALYLAAFSQEVQSRRVIIPEARLVGAAGPTAGRSSVPLKLSRQPMTLTPAETVDAGLDELPLAATTLAGPPAFALPADELPGPARSLTAGAMASLAAAGPVSTFFGRAGNAHKVVYVVDVSASLWIYIDEIVRELRRSIRDLVPTQRFNIVLARPRRVEELSPGRLVLAVGRHKDQASEFLDTIAGMPEPGKADPIEAMHRAFAAGPELIYFLSDGDYRDIETELELMLKRINRQQEVKITVIGFGSSPRPRALLERIAREHGGHFRAVEPE